MFKSSTKIIIRFPAGAPMATKLVVIFYDTVRTEWFGTLVMCSTNTLVSQPSWSKHPRLVPGVAILCEAQVITRSKNEV